MKNFFKKLIPYIGTIVLFILSYALLGEYVKDYVPLLSPVVFALTYYLLKKANSNNNF